MTVIGDGLRLAIGTLTAVPVPAPSRVDRQTARWAVALAPVAVLPIGFAAGLVVWLAGLADLPPLAVALLVVATLALGTRAFHLDGLSDVADGLTASYDRERSLAVMKSGTSGPAGTVALLVVLGLQVAGLDQLMSPQWSTEPPGWFPTTSVVVALTVCLSRGALLLTCVAGVPSARPDGLGEPFAGAVPRPLAVLGVIAVLLGSAAVGALSFDDRAGTGHGAVVGVVAIGAVAVLLQRAVRRFGGTTGDVHGAAIELTLAVLLVGLAPGIGFRLGV